MSPEVAHVSCLLYAGVMTTNQITRPLAHLAQIAEIRARLLTMPTLAVNVPTEALVQARRDITFLLGLVEDLNPLQDATTQERAEYAEGQSLGYAHWDSGRGLPEDLPDTFWGQGVRDGYYTALVTG